MNNYRPPARFLFHRKLDEKLIIKFAWPYTTLVVAKEMHTDLASDWS